jgi:hypothetical protein
MTDVTREQRQPSGDDLTALLDDIESRAEAATPGPYELRGSHELRAVDRGGMRVGLYPHIGRFARAGDAAFFARCDPDTIRALVQVARAADALCSDDHRFIEAASGNFGDAVLSLRVMMGSRLKDDH